MKQGKYDIVILPIKVDGVLVGNFVRKRTARQAWEDMVQFNELRRLFQESIDNCKTSFRTPIFEDEQ